MSAASSIAGVPFLTVEPLTGALGAVVTGVNLNDPLDDATRDAIYAQLLEHQVIFFRNQHLSDDAHLAVAKAFGEPFTFPVARLLGGGAGNHLGYIKDTADSPPKADDWTPTSPG